VINPTALQALRSSLRAALLDSTSPVERDIATLLAGPANDPRSAFRLGRYQRKIDVARRVMAAYDDEIGKPTRPDEISTEGYLGLALVFMHAAVEEDGVGEGSRAKLLRWVNSAANCVGHVGTGTTGETARAFDAALDSLLLKGAAR
jgi:hypothetical protein